MAEQDQASMQGAEGVTEGAPTGAPDYEALYKSSLEELEKVKENSRKWEKRSKSNAEKAKAYDDLQGKSKTTEERLAALEEENKTLKAKNERADLVAHVSKETGVDQALVSTLSGADEDELMAQAKAIADAIKAAPRYPAVSDDGKVAGNAGAMTEEEIDKIKNPRDRVRMRAQYIRDHRK